MESKRRLQPEDVLGFKSVSDAQLSLDGGLIAYVLADSFIDGTKEPLSQVWSVETSGGDPFRMTDGPSSDVAPRWSPDGRTLAFLSDREEAGLYQIYLQDKDGGPARPLTSVTGSIATGRNANPLAWSPDGRQIAFLMTEPKTDEEREREERKDDAVEFERHLKFTHIYLVDVASHDVSAASPAGLQVWEFCWSPDGKEFAVVASDLPFEYAWYTCRLAAFAVDGGPVRTFHFSKRQLAKPTWSPDGAHVAFITSNWSDRGMNHGSVYVVSAGGQVRDLSDEHVASVHSLAWTSDSERIVTVAHERGGAGIAEIDLTTEQRVVLWRGDAELAESSSALTLDRDENVAGILEDASTPPDVVIRRHSASGLQWTRLTSLHPQAEGLDIGSTQQLHWQGADEWDIQGLLIRPPGAPEDARLPLVTFVHGGPTGVWANRYYPASRYVQLLAARGMAVFLPNPRGSTGWGLEFAESNIGDMGGKDWEDIRRGIDWCIMEGFADPERLGIVGNSYGGFMAAWAVTQTDRFKAAIMSAGISDWRSFHGTSSLSDWDSIHYGDADPWDPDGLFGKFSPITYVSRVKTPTLILHGEKDDLVPVEQAYIFYRALKDHGCETELVVYPREGHGNKERAHILDQYRRAVEWFADRLVG